MKAKALIAWFQRLPCRLGSHDWYVLEARIDDDTETVHAACTKCLIEDKFTNHLTQHYHESVSTRF